MSDEFSTHNSNSTYLQQTILLTDIFGKMKCTRPQFDGAPLDVILMKLLRRSEIPTTDPLEQIKRYHRSGLELNYDNEWQNWIDLESRKRVALLFFYWDVQQATIFGREMCQTAFDHRVYLPCEEFLWNANTSQEWVGYLDGQMETLSFLETLRIFLDPKRQLPVLSPLSSMFILHGLISVGFDLHRRSSPIGPSPEETAAKQSQLLRAYEKWATYYNINVSPHLSQITSDQNMVMYHSAYISLHTNIHNLITTAGDSRIFKRTSERDEHQGAKFEIQQWANTAAAKLATWHAVKILVRSLGRPQLYLEHFHVPWSMYVATLVCWAYGQFSSSAIGPGVQASEDEVIWDAHQDISHYLRQMNTDNWEDLVHVRGQTRTAGLLTVVQGSMEGIRWGLIQESVEVLKRLNAPRKSV
ncbi:hypothetical protein P167DRAFT_531429 [Morchella conica CCBAS932]|uniref:Xylanolytic transcriptional activator regulatory domain-containing protein n=1 Tax=Morchella conica CCBAS932 TaxID=1392247 RepID=A0A3N4L5V7_9PEZI|nr:hypothetical protein P167DRAFT_531429 [Morchella conica CCBAS932]